MGHNAKYDHDFYAWTQEQAARLRDAGASGANLPLDWENLAEEIESLGRSDFRTLTSQMSRIVEHLLKLEFSPAAEPRNGWSASVIDARSELALVMADSPSLRHRLPEALTLAWRAGRRKAALGLQQDGISEKALPADCPYTVDEVFDLDFWPANRQGLV